MLQPWRLGSTKRVSGKPGAVQNLATHFLDPKTGVNVIADPAGNYVSGWKLGAEQLESVLTTGRLF